MLEGAADESGQADQPQPDQEVVDQPRGKIVGNPPLRCRPRMKTGAKEQHERQRPAAAPRGILQSPVLPVGLPPLEKQAAAPSAPASSRRRFRACASAPRPRGPVSSKSGVGKRLGQVGVGAQFHRPVSRSLACPLAVSIRTGSPAVAGLLRRSRRISSPERPGQHHGRATTTSGGHAAHRVQRAVAPLPCPCTSQPERLRMKVIASKDVSLVLGPTGCAGPWLSLPRLGSFECAA